MKPESVVLFGEGRGGEPDSSQAGKSQSGKGVLRVPEAGLDKRHLRLPAPEAGGAESPRARPLSVYSRLPSACAQPPWLLSSPASGDAGQIGEPTRMPSFYLHQLFKGPWPKQSHLRCWGVKASTGESGEVWGAVQSRLGEGSGRVYPLRFLPQSRATRSILPGARDFL